MNTKSPELWCEHEFVVRVKNGAGSETHTVSVYGDNELLEDVVTDDAENRLAKRISVHGNERDEIEYNRFGQTHITRHTEPSENGTILTKEASHGAMRIERATERTTDGRSVVLREQLYAGAVLQSESETHYTSDGQPSLTMTSNFAADGRVIRFDQVVWHSENCPAISETTEYDWYGSAEVQTRTMHNLDGTTLWQERSNLGKDREGAAPNTSSATTPATANPQHSLALQGASATKLSRVLT